MGRQTQRIAAEHIETYLHARGFPRARVGSVHPLGAEESAAQKGYGYGRPLLVHFESGAMAYRVVLRTMGPDPFGHDRRSDRFANLLLAYDTFNTIPRHIDAIDAGGFTDEGVMVPMPTGEAFLLTDYVEGELYATGLQAIGGEDSAPEVDRARAAALARYLVELHAQREDPERYRRALRDTLGSGEGIFGLCDSYPEEHPVARLDRLEALEHAALRWRWRLRSRGDRCRRTHGDFHPFNLLFREGEDFSVLDCSRGAAGDPADDLSCLSINYLFFALNERGRFDGACRDLWDTFWATWREHTDDLEALQVIAPFFAWRGLVVASPIWYPAVADSVRETLLSFVERLLEGAPFMPQRVDELLT